MKHLNVSRNTLFLIPFFLNPLQPFLHHRHMALQPRGGSSAGAHGHEVFLDIRRFDPVNINKAEELLKFRGRLKRWEQPPNRVTIPTTHA